MVGGGPSSGPPTMSPVTASMFIFNLIVGTGALALPAAFQSAGWLLGLVLLSFLAATSYITATWVIESIAACNGVLDVEESCRIHRVQQDGDQDQDLDRTFFDESADDRQYLVRDDLSGQVGFYGSIGGDGEEQRNKPACNLGTQLELAKMADILYNKTGKVLFSLCMVLYLYGDLAIYCTAVAKTLRDVTCTVQPGGGNCSIGTDTCSAEPNLCWQNLNISRQNVYRVYVGLFLLLLGPFTFFNVTKTKYLQMLTTVLRWTAFSAMIGLATARILDSSAEHGAPRLYSLQSIPQVFGVSVYAFMCHHSIPSLISPIKNKDKLGLVLAGDYILIASFYILLSLTGIFAFPQIPDLYTLAFKPERSSGGVGFVYVLDYFLALFPVFTLSTNFPIIGITLRNNLESIITPFSVLKFLSGPNYRRIVFPLLAIIPPALVSLSTENLGILVTITGAYAGAGIQYVIPATLVWLARRRIRSLETETNLSLPNPHQSPFSHCVFVVFILVWSFLAVALVTANFVLKAL